MMPHFLYSNIFCTLELLLIQLPSKFLKMVMIFLNQAILSYLFIHKKFLITFLIFSLFSFGSVFVRDCSPE